MMPSGRVLGAALLVAVACAGRRQEGPDALRRQVRTLADAGRMAEAEAAARRGGAATMVALGEVLAMEGHLAAADSVLSEAIRRSAPERRTAEAALAELAVRRGDGALGRRRAEVVAAAYEREGRSWGTEGLTAAGRAFVVLGDGNPEALRSALRAFDAAVAADSSALEPSLRLGDLFLAAYNAPEARASYAVVLRRSPKHPRAQLGMARVLAFEGSGEATAMARASLEANPALAPAEVLLARLHLDAEQYDSAAAAARRALAADSSSLEAWAMLGAVAWLREDTAGYGRARAAAARVHPRPAGFFSAVAEAVARHRRYAEAESLAREAVAADSLSAGALGALGINELRLGNIAGGRAHLERAFARDPFHVWYKNTLDLLDKLATFRTIRSGRFEFVAAPEEAELLVGYLGPLLEEAYDSLAARYGYRPTPPVRVELFRTHADFSVRTVGLAGLGALGVSFGRVLVMDAPSARDPGTFNWGSTAWHELAHTFTLGLSAHRVPRWFSEGLSVLEERRARPGWGADPSPEFVGWLKAGRLLPVSRLNDGFVRPSQPLEIGFSYYQASLLCEMIEQQWGHRALVAMLEGYRDGQATPGVFASVLRASPEELSTRFDRWLRQRFSVTLAAIDPWEANGPPTGEFLRLLQDTTSAAALQRAEAIFPSYAGGDAPALGLARLARAQGDRRAAVAALERHNTLDESALGSNLEEAALREELGDSRGALTALERLLWVAPYQQGLHQRIAVAAERLQDWSRALRERRALLALGPSDPLEARYQLARTLAEAGQPAEARREVLRVLEAAPGFEKAQGLLLELRKKSPEGIR